MGKIVDMLGNAVDKVKDLSNSFSTYEEKMNALKQMPPHVEWDDIKEGDLYYIPKLGNKSRRMVIVKEKTDVSIRCKELDKDGDETSWLTILVKSEVEINFLVKPHYF